jgi:RNA polymerase sigma-70 factor (sigma-E family)
MTSASLVTRSLTRGPVNPQAGTRRVPLGRNRAEWSAVADTDERFAAYVRDRGEHHLRVAVLLTGDWHAAEDLVQASLVKLYRAWPKLRGDGDPDAYLRRIMVNTHRSWWRARWRRETPAGELPETVIADFADGQALTAQVRQALQTLPRQQRAVLVLRYYADLPEAEVADLLGCSPGTVKTHAHRGLRALRENFRKDHYDRHGN